MIPEPTRAQDILQSIRTLRTTWNADDANTLLQHGGILIGITSFEWPDPLKVDG